MGKHCSGAKSHNLCFGYYAPAGKKFVNADGTKDALLAAYDVFEKLNTVALYNGRTNGSAAYQHVCYKPAKPFINDCFVRPVQCAS